MKNIAFLLGLFFSLAASSIAQNNSPVNVNKYSINLPDYWKPGNKVWQILTDKLPQVCEELKDKDLCGDNCRPKYTIEFEMTDPYIHDYRANPISSGTFSRSYNFVTSYSFECNLFLFDDKDSLITKIILVDPEEIWTVTNRAELKIDVPMLPQRARFSQNTPSQTMATTLNAQSQFYWMYSGPIQGQTPYSYINENMERLSPTRIDMLKVVDNKFRTL